MKSHSIGADDKVRVRFEHRDGLTYIEAECNLIYFSTLEYANASYLK